MLDKGAVVGDDDGFFDFWHVAKGKSLAEVVDEERIMLGEVVFLQEALEGVGVIGVNNARKDIFVQVERWVKRRPVMNGS